MNDSTTAVHGRHRWSKLRRFGRCATACATVALIAPGAATAADYFVNPSGASGYSTVQAAVDAVIGQSEWNRANVLIAPGVYREQVRVAKPYVSLIGQGSPAAATTITSDGTHTFGAEWGEVLGITSVATAFMARNITVENSTPDRNRGAALAVRCSADRAIFEDVRVLGYQDTLLVDTATRQYFHNSFISGDTDFIFGDATAVFDRCTIESTDSGFITAASTCRATANGLIFLDSVLIRGRDRNPAADDGTTAPERSVFLGRPWRWYDPNLMPSVIFIRTKMDSHIASPGWDPWNETGDPAVDQSADRDPLTRVSEFGSMDLTGRFLADSDGDGMPDYRVRWADAMNAQQAANYTLENIFGPPQFWNSSTQPETSGWAYVSQGAAWYPPWQMGRLPMPGPAVPSSALNLSTRVRVGADESVVISGFIINGSMPKKVILRALGPSLAQAHVGAVLADPVLELRAADGSLVAANDDWKEEGAQRALIESSGIPPLNDREPAIVATLVPGSYTAIVSGVNRTSGIAVAEIYDLDQAADSKLANLSTRGFAQTGNDVIIAGFILGGSGGGSKVLVRALGPSLSKAGIRNVMADPTIELHNANGSLIAANDNWREEDQASIQATGIPPAGDRESAILAVLPQDNYTAVVAGAGGTIGIALVEVFMLR